MIHWPSLLCGVVRLLVFLFVAIRYGRLHLGL